MEIKLDTVNDLHSIYSDMLVFILPVSRQKNSPYLAIYVDAVKFQKSFQKDITSELVILNNNNDIICHTGKDVFGIKKEELKISDKIDNSMKRNGMIHSNILQKDLKIISIIKEEKYTMIKDSSIMPFVKSFQKRDKLITTKI